MSMQMPVYQAMMGGVGEGSGNLMTQFQDQLQRQTGQMLGALGIKR